VRFPFYVSVLLFTRNFFGFSLLLAMLQLSLQLFLGLTCTYLVLFIFLLEVFDRTDMLSSFTHLLSPIPFKVPLPLTYTPNSTNTAELILTVRCTCAAPLPSTHLLTLTRLP
jgi:hypothetical protein